MIPYEKGLRALRFFPPGEKRWRGLYQAGTPFYTSNFSRDSFITGLLLEDVKLLEAQLLYSAELQGKKASPITGEEKGKIHHEFPGVFFGKRLTTYNACDTAGLFLVALERCARSKKALVEKHRKAALAAVNYIRAHLKNGLFYETPRRCGAPAFALKVTYWKDSVLAGRKNGAPKYPVVYPLAHIQALAGLRSAQRLFPEWPLDDVIRGMKKGLKTLWDKKRGGFILAKDRLGSVYGITSDSLHALYFLEQGDLTRSQIQAIVRSSRCLETDAGYLVMDPTMAKKEKRAYHSRTIWPFEQAIIFLGAKKHGVTRPRTIAKRVKSYLDGPHEILLLERGSFFAARMQSAIVDFGGLGIV